MVTCSEGDLRKAITFLQCAAKVKQNSGSVDEHDIFDIVGVLRNDLIEKFVDVCSSSSFEKIEIFVQELVYDGYSSNQILMQLHDLLIDRADISDPKKANIFHKLALMDNNLIEGADEYLQLLDLATFLMKQLNKMYN